MNKSIGICAVGVVVMVAVLFAQRPMPDTLPATGGDITIIPITHGTLEITHAGHVILVDPARRFDDPPFDMPPPPPPGADGRGARGGPPPPPTTHRPPGATTLKMYEGLTA